MTNIRHTGIYVKNIEKETHFYKECFSMAAICENLSDSGELYEQLLGYEGAKVLITKLISEYGKETGQGDMIELIYVIPSERTVTKSILREIADIGLSHIAIGVENIEETVCRIVTNGGKSITKILQIGSRKCCFCQDPEGNGIELIQ